VSRGATRRCTCSLMLASRERKRPEEWRTERKMNNEQRKMKNARRAFSFFRSQLFVLHSSFSPPVAYAPGSPAGSDLS
jgi:hypothetical protein